MIALPQEEASKLNLGPLGLVYVVRYVFSNKYLLLISGRQLRETAIANCGVSLEFP